MAKISEKRAPTKPFLVGAIGGFLLVTPEGDEGKFVMQMFVTRFRANDHCIRKGLGAVEEIPWNKLSEYMRLLPR